MRPDGARVVLAVAVAGALVAPSDATARPSASDRRAAADYAAGRQGVVSFARIEAGGRLVGLRSRRGVPAASVLKVMLLATYLREPSVRDRPLRRAERRLLGPMIRRSHNPAATRVLDTVGHGAVERLALAAGMSAFELRRPWGQSRITAGEQARFMLGLERLLPPRHRAYARRLLATIVPPQRWGMSRARPRGWRLFFKGGWGSGTGRVCHQVAWLERADRRVGVAILVEGSPSHAYATETLRGVAARLLRGLADGGGREGRG